MAERIKRPVAVIPPSIEAGITVLCPLRHVVGSVYRSIPDGTKVLSAFIRYAAGQERLAGDPDTCLICGHSYLSATGSLMTSEGWIPVSLQTAGRRDSLGLPISGGVPSRASRVKHQKNKEKRIKDLKDKEEKVKLRG